jgi:hypothetical protein
MSQRICSIPARHQENTAAVLPVNPLLTREERTQYTRRKELPQRQEKDGIATLQHKNVL